MKSNMRYRQNRCRFGSNENVSCCPVTPINNVGCTGKTIIATKTGTKPQNRMNDAFCNMREELMSLYFVIVELELYLDGHPNNKDALARYRCAVDEYTALCAKFEAEYGPIMARNNNSSNEWLWVKEPWPWEV